MEGFKDNFSKQADIYSKYRPVYPKELYTWLASLTADHDVAWDCGTGNGQAAVGLAEHYKAVIATDPSGEQIAHRMPHDKISYRIEPAERSSIPSGTVDMVTIANALHWFSFGDFYKEVNRVLMPGGIIAAWCYRNPHVSPEIDIIEDRLHDGILGGYWLPENRLVEQEYTTIPFPFATIDAPEFYSERLMNLDDFIWFLNTWSATQRFIRQNGYNPTEEIKNELSKVWKAHELKSVRWKLTLKVGRK